MFISWKKHRAAIAGVLAVGLTTTAHASAPTAQTKCDAALAQLLAARPHSGEVAAIIRTNGPLTAGDETRLHALGVKITHRLSFIHSFSLTAPARNLSALAALPFVTHLSYDGQIKKCDEFTVGSSEAGQAVQQYGLTGAGVGVAVVDSGVRGVQDLEGPNHRLVSATSQVPGDYNPDDLCGHGTHVAGIIAGSGASSTGPQFTHTYYGIARQANTISVRVLDANGQGSVSTVISGIQWVIQNKAQFNIRVMNLSLGHPVGESYTTDPLCQAVEAAWKAGIVVVCAAGNEGRAGTSQSGTDNEGWGTAYGTIQSPGNDPCVITVGATKNEDGNRADDKIATYSSRGPSRLDLVLKPDIVAPGNRIISLCSYGSTLDTYNSNSGDGLPMSSYENTPYAGDSTDYFVLSGTSMAAPVVSGAAAAEVSDALAGHRQGPPDGERGQVGVPGGQRVLRGGEGRDQRRSDSGRRQRLGRLLRRRH